LNERPSASVEHIVLQEFRLGERSRWRGVLPARVRVPVVAGWESGGRREGSDGVMSDGWSGGRSSVMRTSRDGHRPGSGSGREGRSEEVPSESSKARCTVRSERAWGGEPAHGGGSPGGMRERRSGRRRSRGRHVRKIETHLQFGSCATRAKGHPSTGVNEREAGVGTEATSRVTVLVLMVGLFAVGRATVGVISAHLDGGRRRIRIRSRRNKRRGRVQGELCPRVGLRI